MFFAASDGEPNGIDDAGLLSEMELPADAPKIGVEVAGDPNRLVAGGPNGFEPVDDEEPNGNGNFFMGGMADAEEPNTLGVSADVEILSVLGGFEIPDRMSDEGEVVGNAAATEEVLDELPNKEPEGGGPNIFVEVVELEDSDPGLKELNGLVSGVELPKPPKGDDTVDVGNLIFSFSDESS